MDEQISDALREQALQRELEERQARERLQAVAAKMGGPLRPLRTRRHSF